MMWKSCNGLRWCQVFVYRVALMYPDRGRCRLSSLGSAVSGRTQSRFYPAVTLRQRPPEAAVVTLRHGSVTVRYCVTRRRGGGSAHSCGRPPPSESVTSGSHGDYTRPDRAGRNGRLWCLPPVGAHTVQALKVLLKPTGWYKNLLDPPDHRFQRQPEVVLEALTPQDLELFGTVLLVLAII